MPSFLKMLLIGVGLLFVNNPTILLADSRIDPLWGNLRDYNKVLVEKVIRADTFILAGGEKIRLIGLNAPDPPPRQQVQAPHNELGVPFDLPEDPTTSLEREALEFSKRLLQGQYVRLEFDAQKKDKDLYTLAYAFLPDGTFVNAEIVRQGFADLSIQPPNTQYLSQLKAAYQEARREKRGLQGE